MRMKHMSGPIALAAFLVGCSGGGGPRVHTGQDALALLDTLIAEQEKIRENFQNKSYRLEYEEDLYTFGSGDDSHKFQTDHRAESILIADNNLFVESETAKDPGNKEHQELPPLVEMLVSQNVMSLVTSGSDQLGPAWCFHRPRYLKIEELVPLLPSYKIKKWQTRTSLQEWRDVLQRKGSNWILDAEELPEGAPPLLPLYLLRFYADRNEDPSYELKVDPNRGYWVVNTRSYDKTSHFLKTEIDIAVSRNEMLEGQSWLADEYKAMTYGPEGQPTSTHVLRIRSFQADITLPPDYAWYLNLDFWGKGKTPDDAIIIFVDLPAPGNKTISNPATTASNGVLTYSSWLAEGMELSEACAVMRAEGREKGTTGRIVLWEWSDNSGLVEATFSDGKLIKWKTHPELQAEAQENTRRTESPTSSHSSMPSSSENHAPSLPVYQSSRDGRGRGRSSHSTESNDLPATGGNSSKNRLCAQCNGTGSVACLACSGKGQKVCRLCDGASFRQCSACKGSGQGGELRCDRCEGAGSYWVQCKTCRGVISAIPQVHCADCGGTGGGDRPCAACNGSGIMGRKKCKSCDGKGNIYCTQCNGTGFESCRSCNSKGVERCTRCRGTGRLTG